MEHAISEPTRQTAPEKPANSKAKKSQAGSQTGPGQARRGAVTDSGDPEDRGDKRTPAQDKQVSDYCRPRLGGAIAVADKKLLQARQAKAAIEATFPQTMVMEEMPQPREAFVLIRGQYENRGEKVTAGLPAFLPPLPPGAAMNRLGMAQWLVSPDHPLTAARVGQPPVESLLRRRAS